MAGLEALETGTRSLAAGRASWLLAGSTEEALPAGHPGAAASERGAVALVMEPAARVLERARPATAAAGPQLLPAARGRGRAPGSRPRTGTDRLRAHRAGPPPRRRAPGDRRARRLAGLRRRGGRRRAAGQAGPRRIGALEPLLQIAGALSDLSGPVVVVTAAREGNLAVALLTPADAV
ncbi:hypothetical protein ID875_26170 [Streptomyces globisporus]|uniref:Uncharacterized protein n=1 Tax=Streptomyces globisporus TaxID=1908 RepID=A0A927BPB4_STRGL|nr:hypothetical protein [Streptomyces globisporus]